ETTDGHREFDMVIVALGFDAGTGALLAVNPVNGSGRSLAEAWKDGPETYLGMTVAGFPNLFMVNSPGATSVFGNVPLVSEHECDWIGNCIAWLEAHGKTTIEASPEAQAAWTEKVREMGEETL